MNIVVYGIFKEYGLIIVVDLFNRKLKGRIKYLSHFRYYRRCNVCNTSFQPINMNKGKNIKCVLLPRPVFFRRGHNVGLCERIHVSMEDGECQITYYISPLIDNNFCLGKYKRKLLFL